jgi:RNA polymerase sigma-70 factor (ECF subfamily)
LDQNIATFDPIAVDRAGDAELVEQSRAAGGEAFGLLYYRYRDRVYRYYASRVTRREDADDLTQQAFVRAFASLGQYRPGRGSFAAWLFTIVRNIAIDYYRHQRRNPSWSAIPDEATSGDDVEGQAMKSVDASRLRELIGELPPDKQEILALRFAADLMITDIAKVVGKTPEATRKQLTRLVQQLEERFDEPV